MPSIICSSLRYSCPFLHHPFRHQSLFPTQRFLPDMTRRSAMSSSLEASPESRVLIAHSPSQTPSELGVDSQGHILHLQDPKTGATTCYLMMNDNLQELHWFKQRYSSWFLGNHVLEDGSLYMCSLVDPIFLALPILDKARMKRGDDLGKFRALEEILFVEGYPCYTRLQPLLQHSLDAVCEVREVGASKFYRLDDCKVLAWLCCKVKLTLEGLQSIGGHENSHDEEKKTYAVGLLGEYLQAAPWLDMLCHHLSVDLEASKKVRSVDTSDIVSFCAPNSSLVTKDVKASNGKSRSTKKGPPAGTRKMSEFFALKR